jgi:hypothetical protein
MIRVAKPAAMPHNFNLECSPVALEVPEVGSKSENGISEISTAGSTSIVNLHSGVTEGSTLGSTWAELRGVSAASTDVSMGTDFEADAMDKRFL